jgi:hypothetical protein
VLTEQWLKPFLVQMALTGLDVDKN